MPGRNQDRLPHASLDAEGRLDKARKIERLLELGNGGDAIELLEIGTGSGAIAQYFANQPAREIRVRAVDVVNQVTGPVDFEFRLVEDTTLPFEDAEFDVVISNHVLEHVGEDRDQLSHLREIGRVMKPGGVGYLATPNRWAVVEPHYRVLGLSWLPSRWRTPYLRLTRRGEFYDCAPLSRRRLRDLIANAGLSVHYMDAAAVRATLDFEDSSTLAATIASLLPDPWIQFVGFLLPTHVGLLKRLGAQR